MVARTQIFRATPQITTRSILCSRRTMSRSVWKNAEYRRLVMTGPERLMKLSSPGVHKAVLNAFAKQPVTRFHVSGSNPDELCTRLAGRLDQLARPAQRAAGV